MKPTALFMLIWMGCYAFPPAASASLYNYGGSVQSYFFAGSQGKNAQSITLIPSLESMVTIAAGPPGTKPSHMVPDFRGKYVFSLNHGGNFVTVLEAGTGKIVKEIIVGSDQSTNGQGCQYAWSKDGHRLWVTDLYDDTLIEIDAFNLKVLRKVKVSDFPKGLTAAEDKGFIYVLGEKANNVAVVRLSDFKVIKTIGVGQKPHAGCYAKGKIYIGNTAEGEKSVTVIDAAKAVVIETIDVGFEDPHFLEANDKNNLLIVASKKKTALVLIDMDSDAIVARFTGQSPEMAPQKARHPMWHSSGEFLYYPIGHKDGLGRIYQLSARNLEILSVSQPAASDVHMLQYNTRKTRIYAGTEGNPHKKIPLGVTVYKVGIDGALIKQADLFTDIPDGEEIKGHHGSLN